MAIRVLQSVVRSTTRCSVAGVPGAANRIERIRLAMHVVSSLSALPLTLTSIRPGEPSGSTLAVMEICARTRGCVRTQERKHERSEG